MQESSYSKFSTAQILGFSALIVILAIMSSFLYDRLKNVSVAGSSFTGFCNVAGINIHGQIFTYIPETFTSEEEYEYYGSGDAISSDKLTSIIEEANEDATIEAILLEIDSVGGSPVAAEEIAYAIKKSEKPTVAVIRDFGTSAGYWIASAANRIYASKNSTVGSIGVTASYSEEITKDKRFVDLAVGKFKDLGNPERAITDEERELVMRDLNIIHKNFIETVATNRNLSIEKVEELADGSSVLGEQALDLGLIDAIGSWDEAEQYLKDMLDEEVDTCWY